MSTIKKITTQDKEAIKQWAEERGGVPTIVEQQEEGYHPQPLQIYFNQDETDVTFSRKQISWEEFFAVMNEREFAFAYEEGGEDPHYHEFVPEEV